MTPLTVLAALAAGVAVVLWVPGQSHRRLRLLVREPGQAPGQGSTQVGLVPRGPLSSRGRIGALPRPSRPPSPGRRRPPRPLPPALVLDLVAAVLDSGASPVTAARRVAESLDTVGDPSAAALARCATQVSTPPSAPPGASERRSAGGGGADLLAESLGQALLLATGTGLAPAPLVRRAAAHHRRRVALAATAAARRLGVLVLLPTGLCLLPAFVFLGLVPIVIDLFAGLEPVL